MKKIKHRFLAITMSVIISSSCSDITEGGNDHRSRIENEKAIGESKTHDNTIIYKVNGEEVKTTGWNISRFRTGNKVQLNITSNMHIDKRTINVNLNGDKAGTYDLSSGGNPLVSSYGSYAPDYADLLTRYSFIEGEFRIAEVDTIKGVVNGTFEGRASDLQGKSYEITNGKIINGILKPGIQKF
jgi:hypothetical protein